MIRARLSDGTFLLGVDSENIRRLCAGQPIKVDLSDHGGKDTVIIHFGLTLDMVMRDLKALYGPLPPAQPMPVKGEKPS